MRPGGPLADAAPGNRVHARWLAEEAGGELASAGPAAAGSWFASPAAAAWADEIAADVPAAARGEVAVRLGALAAGEAATVVTGQQPGWRGGPLLTLHKIATAVALARRLAAGGRPTVPVFWSGDDDDDVVEALDVLDVGADDRLLASPELDAARRGGLARRRVGGLPARAWGDPPARGDDELGLSGAWREAVERGEDWRALTRRLLSRAFGDCGLLVVSGDDPRLHAAAAGFYAEAARRRRELAGLARDRGRELIAAGGHAQLDDRSLGRSLYRVDGAGRAPLGAVDDVPPDELRPGVLLRGALQDHLLGPRAVVVGPAELAYLRQAEPVHAALGVPRRPLVPRLGAWLLPPGFARDALDEHRRSVAARGRGTTGLRDWLAETEASLARLLARAADVPDARARELAAGRRRRWERGLFSLLRGEQARHAGPRSPARVFPDGRRQERALAWVPLLIRGGRRLRDDLLAAAAAHLDAGAAGDWREWELENDALASD